MIEMSRAVIVWIIIAFWVSGTFFGIGFGFTVKKWITRRRLVRISRRIEEHRNWKIAQLAAIRNASRTSTAAETVA